MGANWITVRRKKIYIGDRHHPPVGSDDSRWVVHGQGNINGRLGSSTLRGRTRRPFRFHSGILSVPIVPATLCGPRAPRFAAEVRRQKVAVGRLRWRLL